MYSQREVSPPFSERNAPLKKCCRFKPSPFLVSSRLDVDKAASHVPLDVEANVTIDVTEGDWL